MASAKLDASIYGIGQLITQRKLFAVPEHQRSFAWTREEIEEYLNDIAQALNDEAEEYFIGLVVLMGPVNGAWQILDGQQRLATTTMLYSAAREWLRHRGLNDDAAQVETEFIGVRKLGGGFAGRLKLNAENQEIFDRNVVRSSAEDEVRKGAKVYPKRSSNRKILDGALFCREWIAKMLAASSEGEMLQKTYLFRLISFVETNVKTVCLDVASHGDAFVLFESLNDRGMDLSALDLVRNYVFSHSVPENVDGIRCSWNLMISRIEGEDADDFLKVFWTSQFGVIQKLQLFPRLKSAYPDRDDAIKLSNELAIVAEHFSAIDDPEHELWTPIGIAGRQLLRDLTVLGNRQARAVIIAAKRNLILDEFVGVLWVLVLVVVRFQIVAQGRAGVIERAFGTLCERIHAGSLTTAEEAYRLVCGILPDDDSFRLDFQKLTETKSKRVGYLLLELEIAERFRCGQISEGDIFDWKAKNSLASPQFLFRDLEFGDADEVNADFKIGNRYLIENTLVDEALQRTDQIPINEMRYSSRFLLTNFQRPEEIGDVDLVDLRSGWLAELALLAWSFNSPTHVANRGK